MLAVGGPGISWETNWDGPEPDNSPTHRAMTGNNIPIVYPLANIEKLKNETRSDVKLTLGNCIIHKVNQSIIVVKEH